MSIDQSVGGDRPGLPAEDPFAEVAAGKHDDPTSLRRLLAAVVDSSDDAIFAKTLDGVILTWNDGARGIYGYEPHEIIGSNVSRLVPPDVENDVPAIMERLRRGERIQHYETERMSRDGRRLRVSLTVSPIRDRGGAIVGASTVARDVTAIRRVEMRRALLVDLGEALASVLDAEEVLRRLADRAVDGLADYCVAYLLESDGGIRRVGLAHADGTRRELVRRLVDARTPRLDDEVGAGMVIRTGERILAREIPPEVLERAAAGAPDYLELLEELGPISSMVLPLRARGRTVGAVAFANTRHSGAYYTEEDLQFASHVADRAALALDNARLYSGTKTEAERRLRAEQQLRRRYDQLQAIYRMTEAVARTGALDQIYEEAIRALVETVRADRASILRFGDDGVLRFVAWKGLSESYRRSVERHSPWSPDTKDADPIQIGDAASEADLDEGLRQAILSEGIRALVFVPLSFGDRLLGKFMLYFDAPREMDAEEIDLARTVAGTISFAVMRVEDEKRVREAKEAAERASQAKSQFLGVMSHELRTPLNSVVGYADLLLMGTEGPMSEPQRRYVERIQESANHQLRLVEEILTYARLEAGHQEVHAVPTDIRRCVADVLEFVRPEARRKGLALESKLPEEPLVTLTDPARLRQILLNLAGNAVKFTDEGSVVVWAQMEGSGLAVEVRDTGPGIPEHQTEAIWEPFAQGNGDEGLRRGGTGLGLTIARRFTDLLGGQLTLVSRVGEGSTFTLLLPYRPADAAEG